MEVIVAVAKVSKYAVSASGDTVEVVERPNGGLSLVMADGQSSGRGAKNISTLVVRKVISLLAEGVRDGAAARAASDALFTERSGKVSATLNIVSIDQQTQTMVITRNNSCPVLVALNEEIRLLNENSQPIGVNRGTRPVITEIELEPDLIVVVYTDGLTHAGERCGQPMDVPTSFKQLIDDEETSPQRIADFLLEEALRLDEQRPSDDISVAVIRVSRNDGDQMRRMMVRLPLDG
jgi:serine phosphatase RsbU (regulator of sigma subunit)